MPKRTRIALGLGALLILAGFALRQPHPPTREVSPTMSELEAQDRQEAVARMINEGILTNATCIGNEAQVTPAAWAEANAKQKRTLTLLLAQWCEDKHSGDRMTMIDSQSGRKLAQYVYGSYEVF